MEKRVLGHLQATGALYFRQSFNCEQRSSIGVYPIDIMNHCLAEISYSEAPLCCTLKNVV